MSDSDDNIVHPTIKILPFTPNMDPVARSLARRICQGFCQFPEVIIDFDGIEFMGQTQTAALYLLKYAKGVRD